LVTASNQDLAKKIAQHLDIFDSAYGSDSYQNLKGRVKAAFLKRTFGTEGFFYIGDAHSDLPVWAVSEKVVTVNATPSLRRKLMHLGKPTEHIETEGRALYPYFKVLRPHQWLKNILIFVPMLAAHQFGLATITQTALAFIGFSLVASGVYVVNDMLDLNSDRAHPRKRKRPFASGSLPITHGGILTLTLLASGFVLAAYIGEGFLLTLAGYYALTSAYSLKIKRKVILDICVLASLFTIRIFSGAVATGIELSVWLFAFSLFFFFSLASVKRQAELVDMADRGVLTAKGRGYRVQDLPIISMIGLAAGYMSVVVMALYINSPSVSVLYDFPKALWGICCVLLYWLTRMVLITHRAEMHDDPVIFAVKDTVSRISGLIILGFAALGVFI
jgi:4-hydroxybenzoate polyprenyltransferase